MTGCGDLRDIFDNSWVRYLFENIQNNTVGYKYLLLHILDEFKQSRWYVMSFGLKMTGCGDLRDIFDNSWVRYLFENIQNNTVGYKYLLLHILEEFKQSRWYVMSFGLKMTGCGDLRDIFDNSWVRYLFENIQNNTVGYKYLLLPILDECKQ
jgi:hypothetical protein